MLLEDLFLPKRIKTNLEAEDKEEVFEELVEQLVQSYNLDCRDDILASIHERELKMTTGIKKGIAIPHGKTGSVQNIVGCLGISSKGIDYESLDGEPVYVLFLLVTSDQDTTQHIRVLKKIAQMLEITDFYNELVQADSPEKAHKIVKKYEEMIDAAEK